MKQTLSNQSVEKTLRIIETLASSPTPMRLSELARQVEMPSCTVLRMVGTLIEQGYAYQEEEGLRRYALTTRFLGIGQMAAEHISIREIAHPYLIRLSSLTGESSCLAISENDAVRYLDVTEGNGSLITIRQRIGGSAPMHCTGSGKLFLMQYSTEKLKNYVSRNGLASLTVHTLTTLEDLQYDLNNCLKRGYALDDEECEIGMRCVATPIRDMQGNVVAALSVSGPISRMTRLRYETEIVPQLLEAAHKTTRLVTGQKDA